LFYDPKHKRIFLPKLSSKIKNFKIFKVVGDKVYPRWNQNKRAHAVTACIGVWCHGAMHAVHACISQWGACIGLWCHRPMHALTVWDLKFQVCLRYTFTPATLQNIKVLTIDI
jgi:hypothetical protein